VLITPNFEQPIAKNALTILINVSHDAEILKNLAEDDAFVEELVRKITVSIEDQGSATSLSW